MMMMMMMIAAVVGRLGEVGGRVHGYSLNQCYALYALFMFMRGCGVSMSVDVLMISSNNKVC